MPCEDGGGNGSDSAGNKRKPRTDNHHHNLVRGKEGLYSESQREHSPTDTLILNFRPPEL